MDNTEIIGTACSIAEEYADQDADQDYDGDDDDECRAKEGRMGDSAFWKSEESRALLRQAWPDGYLAVRGVQTVGGLLVLDSSHYKCASFWEPSDRGLVLVGDLADDLAAGRLLPLPDPTDTATWACLLADLDDATGAPPLAANETVTGRCWVARDADNGGYLFWYLITMTDFENRYLKRFDPACESDTARALIRARIDARKRFNR